MLINVTKIQGQRPTSQNSSGKSFKYSWAWAESLDNQNLILSIFLPDIFEILTFIVTKITRRGLFQMRSGSTKILKSTERRLFPFSHNRECLKQLQLSPQSFAQKLKSTAQWRNKMFSEQL